MYSTIMFFLFISAICISEYKASEDYDPCVVARSAPVNPVWFKKIVKHGMYMPIHSNCNNCKKQPFAWLAPRSQAPKKRMCFTFDIDTPWGFFSLPYNCEHSTIDRHQCEMDVSGTKLAEKSFGYKGEVVFTKTDNMTYVAGAICIYGKENMWFVASIYKKLDPEDMDDIQDDFDRMGFRTDNVADKWDRRSSPVLLEKITGKEC